MGFPCGLVGKESTCNAGDLCSIPGLGRSPGEGNSYLIQVVILKILKEIGIPDHLTCFLRNLYTGKEATVRTVHGTTDWFQIGKKVCQGCILSPCLFNLYAEYIMRNAGLDKAQAGIKTAERNISNLRYADDTTLKAESGKRTEEPLDESEIGVEKLA